MRLHPLPRREETVEYLLGEVLGWRPAPSHSILWVSWATVFRLFPHEAAVQSSLLSWYCLPPPLLIFTEVNWHLENAHVITMCSTVGLHSLSSHAFSLQHLPQPTMESQLSWRNCAQDSPRLLSPVLLKNRVLLLCLASFFELYGLKPHIACRACILLLIHVALWDAKIYSSVPSQQTFMLFPALASANSVVIQCLVCVCISTGLQHFCQEQL